ncbi:MAG TPA: hypothetical protein VE135_26070 [Pyrinomonadaceae bacterium]|nr:hypothetical protein [Pyrinomonadaceae bacterium]
MNRNQKIAIGCGAAGCLGLIIVCVVGLVLFLMLRPSNRNSNRHDNVNANRSGDFNAEPGSTANSNEADNGGDGSSSSSMSDDDKHKLFQAGAATQDSEIVQRVWKKLGLLKSDGSPNDEYVQFVKDHVVWLFSNAEFVKSLNTPEKARAYVEAHLND